MLQCIAVCYIPCNTLQHTATHCNTLQHTATRSHTLTSTATRLDTSTATCTDMTQGVAVCTTLRCSVLQCVAFPPTHSHMQPDSETHKAQFDVCSAVRCNALRHTYHCNTTHCTTHMESRLVRFRVWLRVLQWYLCRNALQCVAFPATHWSETRCMCRTSAEECLVALQCCTSLQCLAVEKL